jgi:hypothetical protein
MLILFVAPFVSAQEIIRCGTTERGMESVVYLENGSILRGKVTECDSTSLKIEIMGGSVFVVKYDEIIRRVEEEPILVNYRQKRLRPRQRPASSNAVYGHISLVGLAFGRAEDGFNHTAWVYGLKAGYQFRPYMGFGLGVKTGDFGWDNVPWSMAYFLDYNAYLPTRGDWTVMASMELGVSRVLEGSGWFVNYSQRSIGYHISPQLRILCPSKRKAHSAITFGMIFQSLHYDVEGNSQFPERFSVTPNRWYVEYGISF